MAYFSALWKERMRDNIMKKKYSLFHNNCSRTKRNCDNTVIRRIFEHFQKSVAEPTECLCLKTGQTLPNLLLKSFIGFLVGVLLTYVCFMFFVCQLSISVIHATVMSAIIGLLVTFGLAFSNQIRCLVFLLIPQFFSRIGRYTLTCYALILILTGPATNTLRNSEVLTGSMACSQEQIKSDVRHLSDSVKQPFNAMKDSVHVMLDKLDEVNSKLKAIVQKIERLVISIADIIQSSYNWLTTVVNTCNQKLGTPYDHCMNVLKSGIPNCKSTLGLKLFWLCNVTNVESACTFMKSYNRICVVDDFAQGSFSATIKRKLREFSNRVKTMFYVNIHVHHKYTVSNVSRSASQVAAGIVTEIRNRADPLITWLSWSSCVTSLFLMVIIFRAKYYQNMYETRSRFDNRYVTKELYAIDQKRFQEGRDTILPLNRRERTKYIPTTSFRLIATEKVFMSRSAVFMVITTFKLMIHIIADYSLFWVLTTIRYHGRLQTLIPPGPPDAGVTITGSGFGADLLKSIFNILTIPLHPPISSPISCLPNPHPPDFQRYIQIGIIIVILWLLALFEPYGLRLRHVIMGHHRPERAKARATWLYNHILRTRGSFMKLARRKLHREYKYCSEEHLTFRHWLDSHIPCWCLRYLFGTLPREPHCLLCETTEKIKDLDTHLTRCETSTCPGVFCRSCFMDIGQLCTICLSPADYGAYSDISLEKGSSDEDSDEEFGINECKDDSSKDCIKLQMSNTNLDQNRKSKTYQKFRVKKHLSHNAKNTNDYLETTPLLASSNEKYNASDKVVKYNNFKEALYTNYNLSNDKGGNSFEMSNSMPKKGLRLRSTTKYLLKYKKILKLNKNRSKFRNSRQKFHIIRRKSCKSNTRIATLFNRVLKGYIINYERMCCCIYKTGSYRKSPKHFHIKKAIYPTRYKTVLRKNIMKIMKYRKCLGKFRKKKTFKQIKLTTNYDKNQLGQKLTASEKNNFKDVDKTDSNDNRKKENITNTKRTLNKLKASPKSKNRCNCTKTLCVVFSKCFNFKNKFGSSNRLETDTHEHLTQIQIKDFKRRKKKKTTVVLEENVRQQNKRSRDYRISAYIQDRTWVKEIGRKSSLKDIEEGCEQKQLPECGLNTVLKEAKEAQPSKAKKDPKDIKPRICYCPLGVCICQDSMGPNKIPAVFSEPKDATPPSIIKPTTECQCNLDKTKKQGSNKIKFLKWCHGKKHCCKPRDLQGNVNASAAILQEEPVNISEDEAKSPRRLDFYRSIGNEFNTIGDCLSSHSKICDDKTIQSTCESPETDGSYKQKRDTDTTFKKSFRIKDFKLVLSERYLHLRIKNPAPMIKDLIAQFSEKRKDGKDDGKCTTKEKGITVLPMLQARSCQCFGTFVQDRSTQIQSRKQVKPPSPPTGLKYEYTKEIPDADNTVGKETCTCATQYRCVGHDKSCNCMSTVNSEVLQQPKIIQCPEEPSDTSLCKSCRISSLSDDTNTSNTTICSRVEFDYVEEQPRRATLRRVKKVKVNVTTKTNQGTTTDRTKSCDVSTVTDDWWSPMVERKPMKYINNEAGDSKPNKMRKNKGVTTEKRMVKFLSRAQIIPRDTCDILSPSRYLLESQKYYNELFASKLFTPHVFSTAMTKPKDNGRCTNTSKRKRTHKGCNKKRLEPARLKRTKIPLETTRFDETPRGLCPNVSTKKSTKNYRGH